MRIFLVPADRIHGTEILDMADRAAVNLGLDRHLHILTLVVDDIDADERAWIRTTGTGQIFLYCHDSHFQPTISVVDSMMPGVLAWEFPDSSQPSPTIRVFSRQNCDRYLHHQFLGLRDLLEPSIRPAEVPANLAEAFQEVWAVTIDGRLRRNSRPGLSLAERRRIFYRVFAGGGVLMPRHWEIFHELWNIDELEQARILAWAGDLPRIKHSL